MDSPITVPSGKVYKLTATAKTTTLDIPYIGTVHYAGTSTTKTITGIYHGVSYYDLSAVAQDITPWLCN